MLTRFALYAYDVISVLETIVLTHIAIKNRKIHTLTAQTFYTNLFFSEFIQRYIHLGPILYTIIIENHSVSKQGK